MSNHEDFGPDLGKGWQSHVTGAHEEIGAGQDKTIWVSVCRDCPFSVWDMLSEHSVCGRIAEEPVIPDAGVLKGCPLLSGPVTVQLTPDAAKTKQ